MNLNYIATIFITSCSTLREWVNYLNDTNDDCSCFTPIIAQSGIEERPGQTLPSAIHVHVDNRVYLEKIRKLTIQIKNNVNFALLSNSACPQALRTRLEEGSRVQTRQSLSGFIVVWWYLMDELIDDLIEHTFLFNLATIMADNKMITDILPMVNFLRMINQKVKYWKVRLTSLFNVDPPVYEV